MEAKTVNEFFSDWRVRNVRAEVLNLVADVMTKYELNDSGDVKRVLEGTLLKKNPFFIINADLIFYELVEPCISDWEDRLMAVIKELS